MKTMLIFNLIEDLDQNDIYMYQISLKSTDNNLSYRPDTKHSWPSAQYKY